MKNVFRKTGAVFVSLLVLVLAAFPAFTLAAGAGSDIGFYVKAQIPANQIDKNQTYFDLLMKPGDTQVLAVDIFNTSAEPITVQVDAISASTNSNGIIDYKTPDIRDKTLLHPFSELATVAKPNYEIAAGASTTAQVTVSMPQNEYDGVVLGGIVFTKLPPEAQNAAEPGTAAVSIENVYTYLVGVKLSENENAVQPSFEMDAAKAESVNYQAAVTHYIRNNAPLIVKNMNIDVNIYKTGTSEVIAHVQKTGVDMAPNSVMPLAVTMESINPETGKPENGKLEPGDYTSIIKIEENGKTHELEASFSIDRTEIASVEKQNVVPTNGRLTSFQLWMIFLGISLLLLLVIIFLLLLLAKRRKKEEDEEEAPTKRNTYHK